MSATKSGRPTDKPNYGNWDWRAYGPRCRCELDDLRQRAILADPKHITLPRFIAWLDAEFAGESYGHTQQRNTIAMYRRFLYELQVDTEPAHGLADVTRLPCQLPQVRPETPSGKEAIAGPWDWRRYLPACACDLDSLRIRASEAYTADPARRINLGRFLVWAESQAKNRDVERRAVEAQEPVGDSAGPAAVAGKQRRTDHVALGTNTLSKFRRFLWELNVDHKPVHPADVDVDVAELPCSFGGVGSDAENRRSDQGICVAGYVLSTPLAA